MLAVPAELFDALADVLQRLVCLPLLHWRRADGVPAASELLDRGDIHVPVVQVRFELRHLAHEEPAVLADGVAGEGRDALRHPPPHERERLSLRLGNIDLGGADAVDQPGTRVCRDVPCVHQREVFFGASDREVGALGDDVEVAVRDQRRDLDDHVPIRIEPGHLQVEPHEAPRVFASSHAQSLRAMSLGVTAPRGATGTAARLGD